MPVKKDITCNASAANDFLKQINGNMHLILCKYDGNKLVQKNTFPGNALKMPSSEWQSSISMVNDQKEQDVIEFSVTFKITSGSEKSCRGSCCL